MFNYICLNILASETYFNTLPTGVLNTTVKAFVVTPKMTKKSIIFRGGYYKGYKIFIGDKNLFVCILIYLFLS